MRSRWPRRSASLLVVWSLVVAACAGPSAAPPDATPNGTGTPPASARPTRSPGASAASDPGTVPPAATLAVDGGDQVAGQLGTYTWRDGGSDAPWLRGAPLVVGSGETLTLAIDPPVPLDAWSARAAPAGASGPDDAVRLDDGQDVLTFSAPPSGDWTVEVALTFADGLGEAHYFWAVTVMD